ncbi:MAG: hypothetical protein KAG97_12095, partial [Victivallales bacterium]|nr:hypothetical protein [Victivallales bacterium]
MVGNMRAGVARRDITTDEPDVPVLDRLYTKALVLDDGSVKIAVVTMDVTSIGGREISDGMLPDVGEDFLPKLRERIERELGIPGSNVLVNASHTHPPGRMLCDDEEQVERVFAAVAEAAGESTDVKVGSGSGSAPGLTINRTLKLRNGNSWTLRHTNPSPPDDEVAALGPVDDEVCVIRIDRLDGTPLAVVYNFACHPLFGDAKGSITANYPGIASKVVEERMKGATALFLQGAAGDVMDVNFKTFFVPRDVRPMGIELGLRVLDVADSIETGSADIEVADEMVEFARCSDCVDKINDLLQEQSDILAEFAGLTLNFKMFLPLYIRYKMDPKHPLDHSSRYMLEKELGLKNFS